MTYIYLKILHDAPNVRKDCSSPKFYLTILDYSLWLSWVKNPPANKTLDSIPGLGIIPGEGKVYPMQCSGLENPMDKVHGVAKRDTIITT